MTSFLIVDDHGVVRRGVSQILHDTFISCETLEADSGESALSVLRSRSVDCMILDLKMGKIGGLDVLRTLAAESRQVPTLVLSMHTDEQIVRSAIQEGARGFLEKDSVPEKLAQAVNSVLAGATYLSDTIADRYHRGTTQEPRPMLSRQEYKVLQLIVDGVSIKEMAAKLSLSPKTISTYRKRILEKLHLESNADLVKYVLEHGLTP